MSGAATAQQLERPLPHSAEAEGAVLGALILDGSLLCEAAGSLTPDDFYIRANQLVSRAMLSLSERGAKIDPILLNEELRREGVLEQAGGLPYVSELTYGLPAAVGFASHLALIRDKAAIRQLVKVSNKITSEALEEENEASIILDHAEQMISALADARSHARPGAYICSAADLISRTFPEPLWTVPNLLPEGVYLLAGRPKLGKSWCALGISVAVSSGGCVFGNVRVERGEVLHMALEDGERRCRSRLAKMLGASAPPPGLHFAWKWPRLDAGGLRAMEGWLKKRPAARLVVIDTLKRVRPQERAHARLYDTDYDSLAPLGDLARKYGVTILVVHHTRKADSDDPLDLISGSTGLTGAADGALVLKRSRGQADATLHAVCRDLEEDREIALQWDAELSGWRALGEAADVRQSKEREAVKDLLRRSREPLTPKAVAEILGRAHPSTKKLLWTMAHDGDLHSDERGRYSLKANCGNPGYRVTGAAEAGGAADFTGGHSGYPRDGLFGNPSNRPLNHSSGNGLNGQGYRVTTVTSPETGGFVPPDDFLVDS